MGILCDYIEERRALLAEAVVLKGCCLKEKGNMNPICKKCILEHSCSYTEAVESSAAEIIGEDISEINLTPAVIINSCAEFLLRNRPYYIDIEEDLFKSLFGHLRHTKADSFYRKAKIYKTIINDLENCVESVNGHATACCNGKCGFEELKKIAADELRLLLPDNEVISLSSYLLFNRRYDEEWYALNRIDDGLMFLMKDESSENDIHTVWCLYNDNRKLTGYHIEERYNFFYSKTFDINKHAFFNDLTDLVLFWFFDNNDVIKRIDASDSIDVYDELSRINKERLNETVEKKLSSLKLEFNEYLKRIEDRFCFIFKGRSRGQDIFKKELKKNPDYIYEQHTTQKTQYIQQHIYFAISKPLSDNDIFIEGSSKEQEPLFRSRHGHVYGLFTVLMDYFFEIKLPHVNNKTGCEESESGITNELLKFIKNKQFYLPEKSDITTLFNAYYNLVVESTEQNDKKSIFSGNFRYKGMWGSSVGQKTIDLKDVIYYISLSENLKDENYKKYLERYYKTLPEQERKKAKRNNQEESSENNKSDLQFYEYVYLLLEECDDNYSHLNGPLIYHNLCDFESITKSIFETHKDIEEDINMLIKRVNADQLIDNVNCLNALMNRVTPPQEISESLKCENKYSFFILSESANILTLVRKMKHYTESVCRKVQCSTGASDVSGILNKTIDDITELESYILILQDVNKYVDFLTDIFISAFVFLFTVLPEKEFNKYFGKTRRFNENASSLYVPNDIYCEYIERAQKMARVRI